jgi:hypothetical protein
LLKKSYSSFFRNAKGTERRKDLKQRKITEQLSISALVPVSRVKNETETTSTRCTRRLEKNTYCGDLHFVLSVGITLGYGLDDRGLRFDSRRGLGIFLFTTESRTVLGPTQPPIQWVPGSLSLRVKRQGREAEHSPPSSAEFKE